MAKSLFSLAAKLKKKAAQNGHNLQAEKAKAELTAKWFEALTIRQRLAVELWISREKLIEAGIDKGYLVSREDLLESFHSFDGTFVRTDETYYDITLAAGAEWGRHATITDSHHPEGIHCIRRRPKVRWPALKFNQVFMDKLVALEDGLEEVFIGLYNNFYAEWSELISTQVSQMNHEFWRFAWRIVDHLYRFDSVFEGHGTWCDFDSYDGKESWLKEN